MLRRAASNAIQQLAGLIPVQPAVAPVGAARARLSQVPWPSQLARSIRLLHAGYKHALRAPQRPPLAPSVSTSKSSSSSSILCLSSRSLPPSSCSCFLRPPCCPGRLFATDIQRKSASNPGLKFWRPVTPGQRGRVTIRRTGIWKGGPMRCLVKGEKKHGGRNSHGRITVRHRGGGARKKVRAVNFKRHQVAAPGVVERLEYDPGRTGYIALVKYPPGSVPGQGHPYSYILAPQNLAPGDKVQAGVGVPIKPGNTLALGDIPVGMSIHNIELVPGKGGQLCRAAGCGASIVNKQETHAIVRLPSGEQRLISLRCHATIGAVSNPQNKNKVIGKAGYNRHRGIRPTVRGVAMNPVDHPHGGSTAGGRPSVSPWGLPAKGGYKTRDKHKASSKFILVPRPRRLGRK